MQFDSMESEGSSATARGALPQTAMPANGGSFAETSQMQTLHKQLQSALKEIGMLRQQALAESQSHTSLSGLDGEPGVSGMSPRITAPKGHHNSLHYAAKLSKRIQCAHTQVTICGDRPGMAL